MIGGMVLGLLFGCNNGEIEKLKNENNFLSSISNLGKGFLSVFTDLGDMVTEALGIKSETKKDDIGKYFTDIETTMKKVKERLNTLVGENGNYAKVKEKVDGFIKTIETIEAGAKTAAGGAKGEKKIGGAPTAGGQNAAPANKDSVNLIVNGIKAIVGVVLKKGEGNAEFDKTTGAEKNNIGKMLSGTNGGSDGTDVHAAAASASIGAVSGADILRAIEKSGEAKDNTSAISAATDAAQIAASKKQSEALTAPGSQKDAVIAAGIALRAMAEGGEFAAKNEAKSADAVNGASASAVNKTLSALIIAVRNTVDSGLKAINETLAAVKQEDMSAEKSEGSTIK